MKEIEMQLRSPGKGQVCGCSRRHGTVQHMAALKPSLENFVDKTHLYVKSETTGFRMMEWKPPEPIKVQGIPHFARECALVP